MKGITHHKTLKLLLILAVVLTGAFLCFWFQPDHLARYKAQLVAAGEELALAKLSPPFSPEAASYQQQLNDLAAQLIASPIPPAMIPLMAKTNGGRARVAWAQPTPADPKYGTWEDLALQMDQAEPALADLRQLLASPPAGSSYDLSKPLNAKPSIDLVSRRKTAQALAGAVVHELHQHRLGAVLTNLNALLALARLNDGSEFLVERMFQVAIAGQAATATWEALQASGWTEARLASLQLAWSLLDQASHFQRTAEMERAFGITCYETYRTNATERRRLFGFSSGGNKQQIKETFYESIYLPIWANAWSKGDERQFLENMQPIVEGIRRDSRGGDYYAFRTVFANATWTSSSALDKYRFPVAAMIVPGWQKATTSLLRYETQRQMVMTALALKRHQIKNGNLPENLSALVPELLSSLPTDHMNGRQLTYQRLSDKRFTLRSVGINERDDQGAVDDLIWPEPEADPATQPASSN